MSHQTEEKTYLTLATKIILGFLLCLFVFAIFAPINSSVIANGEIVLTSNKKTISHLEGGIVEEIKVSEGQFVEIEQELIVLNTIQVKAKINQVLEGIKGAEFQEIATKKRIKDLKNELGIVDELLKNSNTSLTRKFDLQRQLHEAEGKLGELISNIASLQNEHKAALDTLERSIIKSPVAGVVMDLKHQTVEGVIAPASEIMFVVPKNDHLIAEVMVNPADIDLLTKGMIAQIQLTAYKSRLMPKLDGKVESISGDSFKNETNGQVYFKARIEISDSELKKLKTDVKLTPGMPVTAFIITGSRTMLQYLLTPIKESAYKAFREE